MIDSFPLVHWRAGRPGQDGLPGLTDAASWLAPEEQERAHGIRIEKRRADWLAGRLNAKALISGMVRERIAERLPPALLHIDRRASGAPVVRLASNAPANLPWAAGGLLPLSLSNTHSHGVALCAAAWLDSSIAPPDVTADFALGADLEWIEPRSDGFVQDFLTGAEQRYCEAASAGERDLRPNLVWSAKESILKVVQRGLTADTWWVTCLPGASTEGEALGRVLRPADPAWTPFVISCDDRLRAPVGVRFAGVWRRFEGFVATLAAGWRE